MIIVLNQELGANSDSRLLLVISWPILNNCPGKIPLTDTKLLFNLQQDTSKTFYYIAVHFGY